MCGLCGIAPEGRVLCLAASACMQGRTRQLVVCLVPRCVAIEAALKWLWCLLRAVLFLMLS